MVTIGDPQPHDEGSVGTGIGIALAADVVLFIVLLSVGPGLSDTAPWLSEVLTVAMFGIGLTQLLYVVPLCLHFQKTGQKNTAKGLIIGASIVALLNVTCWGVVMSSIRF